MRIKYLVVSALLAAAVLGIAGNVKAVTIQELLNQIAALQAQILQMQQAQQGEGMQWCHNFNQNLGYANSGSAEINHLHTALSREGISFAPDTVNTFGEGTMVAVAEFQEKYASEVLTPSGLRRGTGYVGPSTRAKLNRLYGCNTTPNPTTAPTVSFTASNAHGQAFTSTISALVGSTVKFAYSSTNATSCYVYNNSVLMNNLRGTDANGVEDINLTQGSTSGKFQTQARLAGVTGVYTVTCSNASGQQTSKSITLNSTPAPATPSITVTSPNGGENLRIGGTYPIRWSVTNGFEPLINITLVEHVESANVVVAPCYFTITNQGGSQGVYNWTVPATIYGNDYCGPTTLIGKKFKITVSAKNSSGAIISSDQSDNYFTIVDAQNLLTASAAHIIGSQSTYTPGQTIKFSVKGTVVDGNPGTYDDGFNVQAYIFKNGDNNYITPNPVGSYNGTYNSTTGYWDVSMTAPSDTTATYTMKVSFYCSQDPSWAAIYGRSAKCAANQITKIFAFTINAVAQPSITVTSPNGGETWRVGETRDITWQSNGIDRAYIMLYGHSSSGGVVYWSQIPGTSSEGIAAVNGRVSWTIPSDFLARSQNASKFSVRISSCLTCYTQQFFDDSNGYFTITAASTQPSISSVNPTAGGSGTVINFFGSNFTSGTSIKLAKDGLVRAEIGSNNVIFISSSQLRWMVDSTTAGMIGTGTYQISVTNSNGTSNSVNFTLTSSGQPSITVTSPNGGEVKGVGQNLEVIWNSQGITQNDKISIWLMDYTNPSSVNGGMVAVNLAGNLGAYNYTVPTSLTPGSRYKIKIEATRNNAFLASDESNNYFTIAAAPGDAVIYRLSSSSVAPGSSVTIYGLNLYSVDRITLYRADNRVATVINPVSVNNNGTDLTFVVPQNVAATSYYLSVWTRGSFVSSNELPIVITAAQ